MESLRDSIFLQDSRWINRAFIKLSELMGGIRDLRTLCIKGLSMETHVIEKHIKNSRNNAITAAHVLQRWGENQANVDSAIKNLKYASRYGEPKRPYLFLGNVAERGVIAKDTLRILLATQKSLFMGLCQNGRKPFFRISPRYRMSL